MHKGQIAFLTYLDQAPATPTLTPPICTIVSISKSKISDETGMNQSIVTFTFDKDVAQWTVNLNGTSHDTGVVVDYGASVTAGTQIQAVIDWNEGLSEGNNRFNIYGQASDGTWTLYNS